MMYVLI